MYNTKVIRNADSDA